MKRENLIDEDELAKLRHQINELFKLTIQNRERISKVKPSLNDFVLCSAN